MHMTTSSSVRVGWGGVSSLFIEPYTQSPCIASVVSVVQHSCATDGLSVLQLYLQQPSLQHSGYGFIA